MKKEGERTRAQTIDPATRACAPGLVGLDRGRASARACEVQSCDGVGRVFGRDRRPADLVGLARGSLGLATQAGQQNAHHRSLH